jgi:hypothetical protein
MKVILETKFAIDVLIISRRAEIAVISTNF